MTMEKPETCLELPADINLINKILADKYVHNLKAAEICKKYKVARATLYRWLGSPEVMKIRVSMGADLTKNRLLLRSEELAQDLLDSINADCIDDMSGLQRVTAYGILVDKSRLMRGESTEIHEHRLDPEYIQIKKAEIVMELQRRGVVQTPQDMDARPDSTSLPCVCDD